MISNAAAARRLRESGSLRKHLSPWRPCVPFSHRPYLQATRRLLHESNAAPETDEVVNKAKESIKKEQSGGHIPHRPSIQNLGQYKKYCVYSSTPLLKTTVLSADTSQFTSHHRLACLKSIGSGLEIRSRFTASCQVGESSTRISSSPI